MGGQPTGATAFSGRLKGRCCVRVVFAEQ